MSVSQTAVTGIKAEKRRWQSEKTQSHQEPLLREGEGQTSAHTPSVYACGSSKPQRVLLPTHLCLRDAQMLLCSDILRTRHGPALSPASSQTVLGTAGGCIPSPPSCFQKLSLGCELHTGWDGGSSRVGMEVICCSMGKSCLTLCDP